MATVRNKSRYDKEMSAVTYNLKEQRVLEKSMQTLKLEQTYAMKLLELDNRIIKVHYKKLKEKVSKIKSHLPPEDISKFRDLDLKGKLKPTISGVSSSGAIKIAAASRRLNLGSGGGDRRRRCVRSAVPRISVENGEGEGNVPQTKLNGEHCPEIGLLHRSNSVTGVFIDAPEHDTTMRPGSASVLLHKSNSLAASERPSTSAASHLEERPNHNILANEKHRPTTSVRYSIRESHDELENGHDESLHKIVSPEKRPTTTPHLQQTHSPFSSHVTAEKEAKTNGLPVPSRPQFGRRLSHVSNDSIDSNLGENLFEERRQELLEEESVRAASLDKRTQMFMKDVDEYILNNPPLQPSHVAFENLRDIPRRDSFENPQAELEAGGKKHRHQIRRRKNDRPISAENVPTFLAEDKYKERMLGLWKGMNKCRYLRMPDERIDLSGVNTLVKDQMKLFETLRNAESVPITEQGDS